MVTEPMIIKFSGNKKMAPIVTNWFNEYHCDYHVNTPLRVAAFLSQVIHESGGFKYTREIWGPTKQQVKYERDFNSPYPEKDKDGRNYVATMLGNEFTGDGHKFAGKGFIQITGRINTLAASKHIFKDDRLLDTPELLATPQYAMLSALWFWFNRSLNRYADIQFLETITKRINGSLNGFADRIRIYNIICNEFNLPEFVPN